LRISGFGCTWTHFGVWVYVEVPASQPVHKTFGGWVYVDARQEVEGASHFQVRTHRRALSRAKLEMTVQNGGRADVRSEMGATWRGGGRADVGSEMGATWRRGGRADVGSEMGPTACRRGWGGVVYVDARQEGEGGSHFQIHARVRCHVQHPLVALRFRGFGFAEGNNHRCIAPV